MLSVLVRTGMARFLLCHSATTDAVRLLWRRVAG
jgi:hypothetical protein